MSKQDDLFELKCDDCYDTPGKIYNNADITSGQWVPCDHEGLTYMVFLDQMHNILFEVNQGPVDLSDEKVTANDYIIKQLKKYLNTIK